MKRRYLLLILSLVAASANADPVTEPPTSHVKAGKAATRQAQDPAQLTLFSGSPDIAERGKAARALGEQGSAAQSALSALADLLPDFATYSDTDGQHHVSLDAAHAIAAIDPQAKIPAKVLARLAHVAAAPGVQHPIKGGWALRCNSEQDALEVFNVLGSLARPALPEIARLNHSPCTEGSALKTSLVMGPPASEDIHFFNTALDNPDENIRRSVIEYLGEARVSAATSVLARAMNDPSGMVRLEAVAALEKLHPEGEARLAVVRPLLQNESPDVRQQAMHLALTLAPESAEARTMLKASLKDSDESVVLDSARAIARTRPQDPDMIVALIRVAHNTDSDFGFQAAEILKASLHRDAAVDAALEPYRERERRLAIEKALKESSPEDRAANARTLEVHGIHISRAIRADNPDRPGQRFASNVGTLYCWTDVSVSTAPASLHHVWSLNGKPVYETSLILTAARVSVWSSKHIKPGKWRVDVRAPNSKTVLASTSFTVTKP